jgi:hypothetical protein
MLLPLSKSNVRESGIKVLHVDEGDISKATKGVQDSWKVDISKSS